jgi:PAS domain S-box-containing protein
VTIEDQTVLASEARGVADVVHDANHAIDECIGGSVMDSLTDHVAVLDARGRVMAVNPAWQRFALENGGGPDVAEPIGIDYLSTFPPDPDVDERAMHDGIVRVLTGELVEFRAEYPCHAPDRSRWYQLTASRLSGRTGGAVVNHHDVTERKLAELALLESEQRLRAIFETGPVAITLHSATGRLLEINPVGLGIAEADSLEEVCERGLLSLVREPYRDAFLARHLASLEGHDGVVEYEIESLRGKVHWLETHVAPMRDATGQISMVLAVSRDIGERRVAAERHAQLEAQLRVAAKMESIGRLAGGVAHDFNNLLTVILGRVDIALSHVGADDPVAAELVDIRTAAERSIALTSTLLALAHRQPLAPQVLDIDDAVSTNLGILRRMAGDGIDLRWHPGTDVWPVVMDLAQITQVLSNLVCNARDADALTIDISTGNVTIDEPSVGASFQASPGDYVRLSVHDDGHGMPADVLANIFEPFFTTKDPERGVGLGLATVYSAVEQHHGFIDVSSCPDGGSAFDVHLPRLCPVDTDPMPPG